ncbi:MAG: NAD-dependent epimerase/dehydratase family protein [Acidimicrobiaceae bacterium]|nr:NAD-dependent epimerase/dehydratase family protein [Acidimicrobiaceae bacterium]
MPTLLDAPPVWGSPTPMRLFVTGGTGVLGRALRPMAEQAGHAMCAPAHAEVDLYDPDAVVAAMAGAGAVIHLATRIRPLDQLHTPDVWRDNDRLRADASRVLVDAALQVGAAVYVQPTVTFVYPPDRPVDEDTPVDPPPILRSALIAEEQAGRFARAGRRGVVLRLGLLDGPGTGNDHPNPQLGATLHVHDAARALLAALTLPSGIYNVCRNGERVSNRRFRTATAATAKPWRPDQ